MPAKILKNAEINIGIIGAGPAGAMLAYLMAQKGYKVTLLERRSKVERKVCGEYLCPKGVELLEELKLYNRLCSNFEELAGMVLVSPTSISIPSYFPFFKKRHRGVSLNREIFDQKLLDLALENGAKLITEAIVTNVAVNSDGNWDVTTFEETFHFDLLVAADGRQSKVGHCLGHIKELNTHRAAIHCYLPRKTERGRRLGEMHILTENRYCGLDPISDEEVNFSIVCDSSLLKKMKAKNIINEAIKGSQSLSAMFDLIDDEEKKDIRVVTNLKNKNHFVAGERLAYVGDAAGFIDPLTGEGIYNALLSSKLLADCIEENSDLEIGLKSYKKKKKKLSFQKNILNHFFQFLIRRPILVNLTANYLKKSQHRADQFIGIIGNIYGPIQGLINMIRA